LVANSIAAGCLCAVLGLSQQLLAGVMRERFSKLSADVLALNIDALSLGYDQMTSSLDVDSSITEQAPSRSHAFVSVHEAIPLLLLLLDVNSWLPIPCRRPQES